MWRFLSRNSCRSLRHLSSKPEAIRSSSVGKQFQEGDVFHGYTVRRVEDVPELAIRAYDLRHESSGAEHLHLERSDSNNCFSLTFRTTPKDSTGVAHILEHLVLCGSERFPCRDPFMKMTQRSLATFLNAMTWPDATMYPFSSTNEKDFANLMEVYLDAVFFPKLRYLDFIQEGWRLEHEDLNDKNSNLCLKGVVFNEMKGAFSSSSALYYRYLLNSLFPDNTYAHESGGEPAVIPELTYQQLRDFYSTHYHPTNARFLTYGNFPLEKHLETIDNRVLSRFKNNPAVREVSKVPIQEKWSSPKHVTMECMPDPFAPFPDKQTTASVSLLLNEVGDPTESFELAVISHLLVTGPNSPFYKAVIASGLGMDYSPGAGYWDYTKQAAFSVGAMGMKAEDADKLQEVFTQTLESVVKEGFPDEMIEGCLHKVEIALKHITANFGLGIAYNILPVLNHDADSLSCLHAARELEKFRKNITDKNYLKEKVREHFLDNSHRLFLVMKPSDDFMAKVAAKEQSVLQSKVQSLSPEEKEEIFRKGIELQEFQKEKDDASVLPTLNVQTDISRELQRTDLKHTHVNQVPVQMLELKTNGINYFKALFETSDLPPELAQYLPLFASVVTKVGAGKRDHRQMDQEIGLRTKGLGCSVHVSDHPSSLHKFEKNIYMTSYCLEKNFESMMDLWIDVMTSPQFGLDRQHLSQLVRMMASDISDGISHAGNAYATSAAARLLTPSSDFREQISGLAYADFMKKRSESEDVDQLIEHLTRIQNHIVSRNRMRMALTAEPTAFSAGMPVVDKFLSRIPEGSSLDASKSANAVNSSQTVREMHVMNFNSNFVGKAVTAVPFLHPDNASLTIAGKIVTSKFLLREVREIGGAYGVGAKMGSGIFTFSSYRDPKTFETLDKFEEAAKWLSDGNFVDEDMSEAKLGTFQLVDKPVTPEHKGSRYFLNRITDEQRHDYRMALLNVNRDHVIEVSRKYLLGRTSGTGYAILGPGKDAKLSEWTIVYH